MSLSRQKVGDGSATHESTRRSHDDDTIDIQISKLDDLADHRFSNLKFIKCDVEGHELEVFFGRQHQRHRPVVQFESTVTDQKTTRIFGLFRDLGYSGVLLLGNAYHHYLDFDKVPHYKFGMMGHPDFLFFPPEAIGTIIPLQLSLQFPQSALKF